MTEPLISVCMITYNHRPYIAEAIEGVLRQETDYPFELVIGEDCSTDGTREIVFDYQARCPDVVRVISSERNVGVRENHERTMAACRGKYVAFCEGDDSWHRCDKLQLQAQYLESHPECALVYSDYDCHYVAGGRTIASYNKYKRRNLPESPTVSDFVLGTGGISGGLLTCTVMVRSALLRQIVAADPYLHEGGSFQMGDTQKWAEIAHLSKIHYIDSSLATHNLLPESASRSRDKRKRLRFYVSGMDMLLYLCDKYALPEEIRLLQERRRRRYSFELAFLERDLALADQIVAGGYELSARERVKYFAMRNSLLHGLIARLLSLVQRLWPSREGFDL